MANKKPANQDFFMRISNPNTFRRTLLESSKATLSILKQIYRVKQIRKTKHELMHTIREEIKELKTIIHKLDEFLPEHNKEDLKKRFPHKIAKKKAVKKPEEKSGEKPEEKKILGPKPKLEDHASEIDKVSKALEDVERKLQSI